MTAKQLSAEIEPALLSYCPLPHLLFQIDASMLLIRQDLRLPLPSSLKSKMNMSTRRLIYGSRLTMLILADQEREASYDPFGRGPS